MWLHGFGGLGLGYNGGESFGVVAVWVFRG
jgi:hypothetical protein